MSIKNLQVDSANKINRNNNPLLPKSIRGCIIGKSGCGKTNLLMNLLLDGFDGIDWLDYDHLYIYGKSLFQPEYKLLNSCFNLNNNKKDVLKCIKNKDNPIKKNLFNASISIHLFESDAEITDPNQFDLNHKNLVLFDDVMLERQSKIEPFYTRGRHNNIDCFYISQNYMKLPRQTIRENSNLFLIFQQDGITAQNIYRDHCTDISKENFKYLHNSAWKEKYGFITIDLSNDKLNGKYRKGLDEFYFPNN